MIIKNYTSPNQYNEWLADTDFNKVRGELCKHGGIEGGPGYIGFGRCDLTESHSNVRYGCEHCPDNCKDYECIEGEKLYCYYLQYVMYDPEAEAKKKAEHEKKLENAFYKVMDMFNK